MGGTMKKSVTAALALLLATGGVAFASTASADSPAPHIERGTRDVRDVPIIAEAMQAGADDRGVRIGGADRYETSALISQQAWTRENAGVVFLATGENFPDALSLSGSFAGVGPILLTQPNELPEPVRGEITRLQPCVVVVVGSEASVSQRVMSEAMSYANPQQYKCNA